MNAIAGYNIFELNVTSVAGLTTVSYLSLDSCTHFVVMLLLFVILIAILLTDS